MSISTLGRSIPADIICALPNDQLLLSSATSIQYQQISKQDSKIHLICEQPVLGPIADLHLI